ncbi:deformed epidermal autoregulatory factor 1 [Ischnura elegans]|uniref:deformed epidermal autoregulatory factor 1 n=1 Tax=Ischnura elegans TaxID=197161 RepID=UPI001ED87D46|nr:deformed epidermal autoregulatory factor 1 [Ischnura elegans]
MEGDRTSEAVVIPDITEPLTNESEAHGSLTSDHHSVTPIAVPVASVPVSLPVGSVIGVASAGTTFNVITPDQFQLSSAGHFKPVLCVDNSFLCDARNDKDADTIRTWVRSAQNGWEQATHIVIQGESLVTGDVTSAATNATATPQAATLNCPTTWNESVHLPVLPVRCKNTSAELHKAKFGSGGRGRCIKLGENWYTPSEFEALCGRASSKDWKRSIRFGGRSLQTLVDEAILTPHATSCTCSACCDDDTATGPIRLFTPYKRRKRKNTDEGSHRMKRSTSKEYNSQSNDEDSDPDIKVSIEEWGSSPLHSSSDATTPSSQPATTAPSGSTTTTATLSQSQMSDIIVVTTSPSDKTSTLSSSTPSVTATVTVDVEKKPSQQSTTAANESAEETQVSKPLSSVIAKQNEAFKKLDEMASKMLKMMYQFKNALEDTKEQCHREIEQLKKEREAAILAARVEVHNARNEFEQRAEALPVHVVDPLENVELQPTPDGADSKRCANCNREAMAECSLCRRTPYCSTFCQRKDWSSHQVECVRVSAVATTSDHTGPIMLIVESSDQVLSPENLSHAADG